MDTNRILVGTLAGAVALFVTGYLIFEVAFGGFYAANMVADIDREMPLIWAIAVGNIAYAALVTLSIASRSSTISVASGAKTGAVVGFLLWCTADFVFYGLMNLTTITLVIVDPLLSAVHGGIGGAAVAAALGRKARTIKGVA